MHTNSSPNSQKIEGSVVIIVLGSKMSDISITTNDKETAEESPTKGKNIVLVGGTGSGKSATANSILNRQEFVSEDSLDRVTTTCQLRAVLLQDGTYLYVIDTPGLFDATTKPEVVLREIAKCITLAIDGLHAILLVFSLFDRFTKQHEAIVETLKDLFGESILDYTILVFTGADRLERTGKTLDQFLSNKPPPALKNLLERCGNRRVAFNNITDDVDIKERQRQQLIDLIGKTVLKNGGNPYSDPKLMAIKNANSEEQIQQRIAEMVEGKMKAADEKKFKKYEEEMQRLQKLVDSQGKQSEEAKNEIFKLSQQLEKARNKGCSVL